MSALARSKKREIFSNKDIPRFAGGGEQMDEVAA